MLLYMFYGHIKWLWNFYNHHSQSIYSLTQIEKFLKGITHHKGRSLLRIPHLWRAQVFIWEIFLTLLFLELMPQWTNFSVMLKCVYVLTHVWRKFTSLFLHEVNLFVKFSEKRFVTFKMLWTMLVLWYVHIKYRLY